MTLIELLVTMTVMGAIFTVLTAAVTVTYRQRSNTEGSLDVARWEQALALNMPTDLASADPSTLDSDPGVVPPGCTLPECSSGSNALLLSFDDGSGTTTVAYRYVPAPDGEGYELVRVECQAGACTSSTVLGSLAAPSDATWQPGVDPVPASVMTVSVPQAVSDDATAGSDTRARSVSVAVNGLPDAGGEVRSSNVTMTVGGVERNDLQVPTFVGPSFVEARSGCGGPVTLLIDQSSSITDRAQVQIGIESFVRAFEGTPTDLQVILFNNSTTVLGGTGSAPHYYDLSDPAMVTALAGSPTVVGDGAISAVSPSGGTNWEAALRKAFVDTASGVPYYDLGDPTRPAPELVVLFTDGLPSAGGTVPAGIDAAYNDGVLSPSYSFWRPSETSPNASWITRFRYWWTANQVASTYRGTTRLIGVGIGELFTGGVAVHPSLTSQWQRSYVPSEVFLGTIVSGSSNPAAYTGTNTFEMVQYDPGNGWGDVSTAHVLASGDTTKVGSGLAAIALAECGGTLTVQTRTTSGAPADTDVSYSVGNEQVTTTRITKAATFDIPFNGAPSKTVQLIPQSLDGTGYTPVGWSCSAGGQPLASGSWSLVTAGTPADGVNVTVTPNEAVSCTLEVS